MKPGSRRISKKQRRRVEQLERKAIPAIVIFVLLLAALAFVTLYFGIEFGKDH